MHYEVDVDIDIEGYFPYDGLMISVNGVKAHCLQWSYRFVGKVSLKDEDLVIKVDISEDSARCQESEDNINMWPTNQTQTEIRGYPTISKYDRQYFPKLLDHGTVRTPWGTEVPWLIQPWYTLDCDPIVGPRHTRVVNRLIEKYGIHDLFECDPDTPLTDDSNWALCNGKVLMYDYGDIGNAMHSFY